MDTKAIRAAWSEWETASAATEAAYRAWLGTRHMPRKTKADKAAWTKRASERHAEWEATLDRTDTARQAVAGLPDLEDVQAYEDQQAAIAAEAAKQGRLF